MAVTKEEALRELYRRGELTSEQRAAAEELARRGELNLDREANIEPFVLSPDREFPVGPLGMSSVTLSPPGKEIAETGVDVVTGAPAGVRAKASFAKNETSEVAYLKERLGTDIRKGPKSGRPEYLREDPETGEKRWTLVDESAFSLKDIGEFGEAIPAIGATAGAVAGSVVGPGTSILGGAGGAAVGELVRLGVGEAMGINEVDAEQYVSDAVETGVFELLIGWGADKAMRGAQAVRRIFQPIAAEADEARIILQAIEERRAEQLASDIETMAKRSNPEATFNPTTGQLGADEYLLAIEQSTLRGDLHTAVSISRQEAANESGLEAAFDSITLQADDGGAVYDAAKEIVDTAKARVAKTGAEADAVLERRLGVARADINAIEDISEQEAGRRARAAIWGARKVAKRKERAAYDAYKEAYGWDGHASSNIKIQKTPEFNEFMEGLNAEKVNAWFAATKRGKGKLTPEALLSKEKDKIQILGPDGTVLSTVSRKTDEPLDLHQLEVSLKELRRWRRISAKNEVATDAAGFDVDRMIKQLEKLRANSIPKELLSLAETAEQSARDRISVFDKGLLRAVIKRDEGGQYMLSDTKVFGYVMASGDKEVAQHFMQVLSQDPGAVVAARKAMAAYYKREVAEQGYADPKLHSKFMDKYESTIEAMFTPAEIKRMNSIGNMGAVVDRSIKRYDNLMKGLEKSFAGKIKNTDPEHIANVVFDSKKMSVSDTKMLFDMLDAYGTGDQARKAVGSYVKHKVFPKGRFNLTALDNLLAKNSPQRMKLTSIYGQGYVKNLEKIHEGMLMVSQRPKRSLAPGKTNAFTDLMRVLVAPPLTRKGRAQTLLVNIRYDAANRALARALLDPNELKMIVSLSNKQSNSRAAARILAQLSGAMAIDDVTDAVNEETE